MVKISCIMPVYNAEKYVSSAIESILNQTFRDFELLILDDGSKDGSLEIIKYYAKQDSRIKYFHRKNRGLPYTLNELIRKADGKYIARMDHDDIAFRDRFKIQYDYMEKNPSVSVVGANVIPVENYKNMYYGRTDCDSVRAIRMIYYNSGIPHPTAFIRTDFLKENNIFYNPHNLAAEDYELWSDIISHNGIIHLLDTPLLYYRIHKGQMMDVFSKESMQNTKSIKETQLQRYGTFTSKETDEICLMRQMGHEPDVNVLFHALEKLKQYNKKKMLYNVKLFDEETAYQWVYAALLRLKHNGDKRMLEKKYLLHMAGLKHIAYVSREFYCFFAFELRQRVRTFVNVKITNPIESKESI